MTKMLFTPLRLGQFETKNRILMAPMTRGRATSDGTPTELMIEYYRQRAAAGLIITEGTFVSPQAVGWNNAPGIYTDAHVEAWKPVTAAVHAEGGRIFLQLWHMGRVSHPDFQDGALPVGPSAIAAEGKTHTPKGSKEYVVPRALEASELAGIVDDFRQGARRAIEAGFDGVEIHGANGYLIDQFIRDGSNKRDDEYGGSIENRWRLPLEIAQAVSQEVGADRTAIRLSPVGAYNTMSDSDPVASFSHGAKALDSMGLAYVHVLEARGGMMLNKEAPLVHPHIRTLLSDTPMFLNGGYDQESAEAALADGLCDAVTFGVSFLANPDLVERFRTDAGFNTPDFATFYSPGEAGYTDYKALS
jgi:N-ethylmaleimide reductase